MKTNEDNFQHFLSYTGYWEQSPEVIAMLRRAYEDGAYEEVEE